MDEFGENDPLPDDYLLALGRVAALSAALESQVELLLLKLAGFDPLATSGDLRGLVLIRHSSFQQKIDAFSSLCEMLHADYRNLSDYAAVLKLVRTAQAARNTYLHNAMAVNPRDSLVHLSRATARGKLKLEVKPLPISDLHSAAAAIRAAMKALHRLVTGVSR
jgi:hypothetical protein